MALIFSLALLLFIAADLYIYYSFKLAIKNIFTKKPHTLLYIIHFSATFFCVILTAWAVYTLLFNPTEIEVPLLLYGYYISLFYLPKTCFILFALLEDTIRYTYFRREIKKIPFIIRKQVLHIIGFVLALALLAHIIVGMVYTTHNYTTNTYEITVENLPPEFDGFRILHLSDWHLGGFAQKPEYVKKVIDISNSLKPDIILHTGDMIDYYPAELAVFSKEIQGLNAPYGQFACLGNHDDGRYIEANDNNLLKNNIKLIDSLLNDCNITLLQDEEAFVHKANDSIRIVGIGYDKQFENVNTRFEKLRSMLTKPYFSILLFHDPSFWSDLICKYTDIPLTLSGHTHGLQYGIRLFGRTFSPSQLKYEYAYGFHQRGNQYLNVSSGIGQTIVPFRSGMPPDITLIVLRKK